MRKEESRGAMLREDADIVSDAARCLVEQRDAAARSALATLALSDALPSPAVERIQAPYAKVTTKRPAVTAKTLCSVLKRDNWQCRYCGRKLVAAPVIDIIGTLCPDEFPFPKGHHMPAARTHPAAIRIYPAVDHVHAGSVGGHWTDEANLVAACVPCNERKSNYLGWVPRAILDGPRDGLTRLYLPLVARLDTIRPYHKSWINALEL